MSDLISRQAAINAIENTECELSPEEWEKLTDAIKAVPPTPSAQPEKCEDCANFNKTMFLIPQLGTQWIPVTTRPMDVEERLEWSEKTGYDIEDSEALIYTSQLPGDGEEVLTCDRYGNVRIDTFANDPDYGCCFEENGDMEGVVAWMPLPEPYKAESEEEHESCD